MYCLSNFINNTGYRSIPGKKVFKIKTIKKLFKINNVKRKIEWFSYVMYQKDVLNSIDINTIIDDFASKKARKCKLL